MPADERAWKMNPVFNRKKHPGFATNGAELMDISGRKWRVEGLREGWEIFPATGAVVNDEGRSIPFNRRPMNDHLVLVSVERR